MGHDETNAKGFVADGDAGPSASRVRYRVLAAACGLAIVAYVHRVGFGFEAVTY